MPKEILIFNVPFKKKATRGQKPICHSQKPQQILALCFGRHPRDKLAHRADPCLIAIVAPIDTQEINATKLSQIIIGLCITGKNNKPLL